MSDRLDTVSGSLTITSSAGLGTSLCVHIPVGWDHELVAGDQESVPEEVAGRERADA